MQVINPSGRKVGVLESRWPALKKEGFKLPEYYIENSGGSNIFISRPLGGLGDAICMEPAVRGVSKLYGEREKIVVDIPKRYWPIMGGCSTDLIDGLFPFDKEMSHIFIDMDCPCDQYESSTGYRPKKDRTTIFCETARIEPSRPNLDYASSLGFDKASAWIDEHIKDPYNLIGIQPRSAQEFKDWPYMQELAYALAHRGYHVILFMEHYHPLPIPDENIHIAFELSIDTFIALCWMAKLIITPDSAAFHIGGSLGIPTLGLFGPTNGALAKTWYPSDTTQILQGAPFLDCPCHFYDPNKNEACLGGTSQCMLQLTTNEVLSKVEDMLCL